MSPAGIPFDELPPKLRAALKASIADHPSGGADLEDDAPEQPAAATKAPGGTQKTVAAAGPQYACCRCGQMALTLAAMERHAHAARHPRYRWIGERKPE